MQLERREYDSLREEERGEKHAKERKWEMRKVDDDDSLCLSVCPMHFSVSAACLYVPRAWMDSCKITERSDSGHEKIAQVASDLEIGKV